MEYVSFFQENRSLQIGALHIGILVFRATDRAMAMFSVLPQYKGHSR